MKYIAVVNPKMDKDDIETLIRKGIAGALFSISHQNYPVAAKLIGMVKELSRKYNKPISIIQDASEAEDPLDLHFGQRLGVNWVASHNPEHLKTVKGLNKLAGIIFKGRNMPQGVRVDSIMADDFVDPDATVEGGQHIKHLIFDHPKQGMVDSMMDLASHAGSHGIAVSDLDLAKALSYRRPARKIIFATKNRGEADKAAIYWGVQPVYLGNDLVTSLKNSKIAEPGHRIADATDVKHVTIQLL